jgi:hypothetical protein
MILEKVTPTDTNLDTIDVLVGLSGKMYIPTLEELKDESFTLVKPYHITSGHTAKEIKESWDAGKRISFR